MISDSVLEKLEFPKILAHISKQCYTVKGKSRIVNFKPLYDKNLILFEINTVSEAKNLLIERENPPIEYQANLDEYLSLAKIEGTILDAKKVLDVLRLLINSRIISSYFNNNKDLAPDINSLSQQLFIDKLLEHHIQEIINDRGEIKDNASKKLSEIRKEINRKKNDLVKAVNRIIKNLADKEIIREDYLTLRDGRIVVPVKAEHKRHIRGFIHSESSTGQTVYIEPEETLDLNNEILSLSFEEKREIERILKIITKKISEVSDELKNNSNIIASLDSIFARAKYAIEIIGDFPTLNESEKYYIESARHPLLLKRIGKEKTVPLNLTLDKKNVVIITGPNAGGKTVVLKTIGLISIMIQCGIPIPASPDSNLHIFNNILVDIGDEQSLEDDLSTFSSHLSNIKEILEKSDGNSLILVDEIGTGTDPAEGAALAISVLISLQKKNAKVLATTHHGSLKLIANDLNGFENAAMEFDHKNLSPTYVFKQGIPGSSYAFEIAQRIGFDEDILSVAKENLDTGKHNIEKFLAEIEEKSFELKEKLKKMEIENSRLKGLSNLYKQNLDQLNKEKKEILKNAGAEASVYLNNLNKKVENAIKDVRETNASKESIKAAKSVIKELNKENEALIEQNVELENDNKNFELGDFVVIQNTQTKGEIIEIDKERKKATILSGSLKIQAKISNLNHSKKNKKSIPNISNFEYSNSRAEIRLDIRGERSEEAEFRVIKFIDEAYSAGLDRIEILHGKGTGALKKTVKDILKKHEKINNFYFAPIELGGEGITIAEFLKD